MLIFYFMINPLPSSILTHSPNTIHQLCTPRQPYSKLSSIFSPVFLFQYNICMYIYVFHIQMYCSLSLSLYIYIYIYIYIYMDKYLNVSSCGILFFLEL